MTTYQIVQEKVNELASKIETKMDADVCWHCGDIDAGLSSSFPRVVESVALAPNKHEALAMFLTTFGGSAEVAEQVVCIMRHFYDKVYFVVPEMAMSAGTILCLSGDEVYMRYTSCLGPIDPQVKVKDEFVSANGYLDKVEEFIDKSRNKTLTDAELNLLLRLDIGKLAKFEQAANLAKDLVKTWLVSYKFNSWSTHSSTGSPVTAAEKVARADEIVELLGDNKFWHSHGRGINMEMLKTKLRLHICDIGNDKVLDDLVCSYHQALCDCMQKHNYRSFFHTKNFF